MPSRSMKRLAAATTLLAMGLAASACQNTNPKYGLTITQSTLRIAPDYSEAVRQDVVAQIADPDAQYKGVPGAASNGRRTADSEHRYVTDTVKQPPLTITQQVVQTSQGGDSSGGGGGGGGGPQ